MGKEVGAKAEVVAQEALVELVTGSLVLPQGDAGLSSCQVPHDSSASFRAGQFDFRDGDFVFPGAEVFVNRLNLDGFRKQPEGKEQ